MPGPNFFRSPARFRSWLEKNHRTASELIVGYYKKGTGKPSITWPESVNEALCFGWIDGIRRSHDELSYTVRFTPRRRGSVWSAVNITGAKELIKQGRMTGAGLAAFGVRRENRSGVYSYEQKPEQFPEPFAKLFRKNANGWAFFSAQPPSYRKKMIWWVISAKKDETRAKRLDKLIQTSASRLRMGLV